MCKVQFVFSLAGFGLMLAAGQAVLGQVPPVAVGTGGGFGVVGFDAGGLRGNSGAPYSAVRKTTHVQKLANGTTITHENTVKEARDSSGRTYRENRPEVRGDADGPQRNFVFYNVFDPVNRVSINWNSNSKEANVMHMPEPGEFRRGPVAPNVQTPDSPPPVRALNRERPNIQVEKLGTKNINGVDAEGTRTTRVIPPGAEGNDQPLTITHESWTSPELRLTVLSISDDPRSGMSKTELTEIDRGEPDPGLFQAPQGYTVKEHFPNRPE